MIPFPDENCTEEYIFSLDRFVISCSGTDKTIGIPNYSDKDIHLYAITDKQLFKIVEIILKNPNKFESIPLLRMVGYVCINKERINLS